MDAVERKCSLAAALSVPDDALANPSFKFAFDSFCGEYLRVAHHVLFNSGFGSDVGEPKAKQKGKAVTGEERSAEPVGRAVRVLVCRELGRVLDADQIVVSKNEVFNLFVFRPE